MFCFYCVFSLIYEETRLKENNIYLFTISTQFVFYTSESGQYNSGVINKQNNLRHENKKFISLSYITELVQYNNGVMNNETIRRLKHERICNP